VRKEHVCPCANVVQRVLRRCSRITVVGSSFMRFHRPQMLPRQSGVSISRADLTLSCACFAGTDRIISHPFKCSETIMRVLPLPTHIPLHGSCPVHCPLQTYLALRAVHIVDRQATAGKLRKNEHDSHAVIWQHGAHASELGRPAKDYQDCGCAAPWP
jgi:hypothetical protein